MAASVIDPSTMTVQLQARGDLPALVVTVWPDPRSAPSEQAAVMSAIVLSIATLQARLDELSQAVGALAVLVTESARVETDAPPPIATRDPAALRRRLALAREHVATIGDAIEIEIARSALLMDPTSPQA